MPAKKFMNTIGNFLKTYKNMKVQKFKRGDYVKFDSLDVEKESFGSYDYYGIVAEANEDDNKISLEVAYCPATKEFKTILDEYVCVNMFPMTDKDIKMFDKVLAEHHYFWNVDEEELQINKPKMGASIWRITFNSDIALFQIEETKWEDTRKQNMEILGNLIHESESEANNIVDKLNENIENILM